MEEKNMTFGHYLLIGFMIIGLVAGYFLTHPKSDK
jgi:hypothetical protein